jgi:hypothetical protein
LGWRPASDRRGWLAGRYVAAALDWGPRLQTDMTGGAPTAPTHIPLKRLLKLRMLTQTIRFVLHHPSFSRRYKTVAIISEIDNNLNTNRSHFLKTLQ